MQKPQPPLQLTFDFSGLIMLLLLQSLIATEVLQPCRHQSLLAFQIFKWSWTNNWSTKLLGSFWGTLRANGFRFRFDSSWMSLERFGSTPSEVWKGFILSIFHREMLWDDVTVVVDVGKRLKTQVCSNRIGLGRDQHQLQSKWAARLIAFVSLLLWGQQDTGIFTRTAGIPNLLAKPSPQSWWTSIKANISFLETLADLLLFQLRVLGRNTSKATYRASTLESLRLVRLEQNLGMEIISAWPCYQMTSDVYGNLTT